MKIYDFLFEQESKVDNSAENSVNLKSTKTKARKPLHSVDQQIDALILKYEASSIIEDDKDLLQENNILSLQILLEQDEDEEAEEPEEEFNPEAEDSSPEGAEALKSDSPGSELVPKIDMDEFTNRCVRLITNHRKLLRMEEAIINRVRNFLDNNYGDKHVARFLSTLENDFGLSTERYKGVYDDEAPEVFGVGANPAGAGMSGG
tara:strand:- start:324 stop:938 length:615 start_codon:yes stop_codon:yes gene_type:complete